MIRLGTRGSRLALAQAERVAARLRALGAQVDLITITTSGDRAAPPDANATGIFVKELETALLAGDVDLAVHSLKDMTTTLPDGLALGAVLARDSALDALICRERGLSFDELPAGARIGTSSPRRRAQLVHRRPDLRALPLRGNVDTRLRKLDAGQFEAIVLAHAGLERLGLEVQPWVIPADVCLPAPGQGALAVEIRDGDRSTAALAAELDDPDTRACVSAERALLRSLGGGCRAAVGALARIENDRLWLEAVVASPEGQTLLRDSADGMVAAADKIGEALAQALQARGAGGLIEAAR